MAPNIEDSFNESVNLTGGVSVDIYTNDPLELTTWARMEFHLQPCLNHAIVECMICLAKRSIGESFVSCCIQMEDIRLIPNGEIDSS